MRITCPQCNAHYEIGEDLIRPEGRDVQCSNCGTTWFQAGRNQPASAGEAIGRAADDVVEDPADDLDGEEDGNARTADDDAPTGGGAAAPAPPPASRRPPADKAALDILREERAREDRLRAGMQADPSADAQVEDMPAREDENRDGGARRPDSPDRDPREAAAAERVRMAAAATRARARNGSRPALRDAGAEAGTGPRGEAELRPGGSGASSPAIAAAAGRRGRLTGRALLPDIEEINSSLRPDDPSAADAGDNATRAAPGSSSQAGFRLGFLAVCACAVALVALYALAEPIGRGVPALAEPLARYVAWVDTRRTDLEGAVEALTERISPKP